MKRIFSFCLGIFLSVAGAAGARAEGAGPAETVAASPGEAYFFKAGINGFFRGEAAGNFRFSDFAYTPGHGEGRARYRLKPYSSWHPVEYLAIHAEGQEYGFSAADRERDHNFSLYQGFVEARLPGQEGFSLKAGRQEFTYGSAFILGADSFFDGLSFDALRLRVASPERLSLDIFTGSYFPLFAGGIVGNLSGAYATYGFTGGDAAELYLVRDTGSSNHHAGEELYIWGGRFTFKRGPFSFELEPVYESGTQFSEHRSSYENIRAYGGHLDMTVEYDLAGRAGRFFLGYAYGSGSADAANGAGYGREFRNPNNDTSLVGDMGVVGDLSGLTVAGHHASGLQIVTVGGSIDFTKKICFSVVGHYFLANEVKEGFSRHLGLETDLTLIWNINDDFFLLAGYDHFFTGGFFSDAVGRESSDMDYAYLQLQFNWEAFVKHRRNVKSGKPL